MMWFWDKSKRYEEKVCTQGKIWKLFEDKVKSNFRSYIGKCRSSSQNNGSVEGYWNVKRSVKKQRKKVEGPFTRWIVKNKGKYLETLYRGMIRNVLCLRLKSGWENSLQKLLWEAFEQSLHEIKIVCLRQI